LIAWLLKELEKNPSGLFREKDLRKRSKSRFEKLKREHLLEFVQPDQDHKTYPCALPCPQSCPMEVVKMDGKLWAICPEDSEIDPLPLSQDDVSKYRLSIKVLAEKFRTVNLLDGKPSKLDRRLIHLGETKAGGMTVGMVLALFPAPRAAVKSLLALPNMVSCRHDRLLVVFPSLEISDQADLLLLEKLNIFPGKLNEKDPFKIDISAALKKLPEKPLEVILTPEEEKEFSARQFKSRLTIEITGEIEKRSTNILRVDGAKVTLGDIPFALFLRLVVELLKGGDGCIYKGDSEHGGGLIGEGFLKPASVDQDIRRLREPFIPALKGLPPTKFIEVFKHKHIRLSTHPRYVLYDKKRLLLHDHRDVRRLAKNLR